MIRRPPRSTRTDTLFPYTTLFRSALLLGGAAATMTLQQPLGAQQAQNEPGAINAVAPKAGAPMSFADMVAKLQPAVVNLRAEERRGGKECVSTGIYRLAPSH